MVTLFIYHERVFHRISTWPVARAEVVRQDVLDAENARPTLPELVSVPEAAEILGVSPQRVRELALTNPAFPEPMRELRTGKLWLRDAIDVFARRDPKPGRPPRTQTALPRTCKAILAWPDVCGPERLRGPGRRPLFR